MSMDDKIAALSPQRAELLRAMMAEREAALRPASDVESVLCEEWSAAFERPVNPMDDFFLLGGDSILALKLSARLHARGWALRGSQLFAYPSIRVLAPQLQPMASAALADGISGAGSVDFSALLTPMQQGMLFQIQAASRPDIYVSQFQCDFPSNLDVPRFRLAWQRLTQCRAALRARVDFEDDGRSVMQVAPKVDGTFDVHDWRHWEPEQVARALRTLAEAERLRGFDLSVAPLTRVALVRRPDDGWSCMWTHHHLLLDGWSQLTLLEELFQLYADPALSLVDDGNVVRAYAANQVRQLDRLALAYWQDCFEGSTRCSFNPEGLDRAVPAPVDIACGTLPPALALALEAKARDAGVTAASVFETAWGMIVASIFQREDVVFGVVTATRPPSSPGVEHLAWMCINTVPVRKSFTGGVSVREVQARHAKDLRRRMERHADPLPEVLKRCPGAEFGSILVIENFHAGLAASIARIGADLTPANVRFEVREHHPIMGVVSGSGRSVQIEIKVDRSWQVPVTAIELLQRFIRALRGCVEHADQPIVDIVASLTQPTDGSDFGGL